MPDLVLARVGRPYRLEAIRMLEAGEGSVAGIDRALESSGYARGPFRVLDAEGLEAELSLLRFLAAAWRGARRFDPPPTLERMVSAGLLGREAGRGFYDYAPAGPLSPDIHAVVPAQGTGRSAPHDLPASAIVERIELATINEAYRVVEEGLASPSAVDQAMRDEQGSPVGPFERAGVLGLRAVIERLRALHLETDGRSGDQYLVAAALWQMATA